jgi:hypothetical protein
MHLRSSDTRTKDCAKASDLFAMLMWNEFHFSQFGFDLIARMQGTYEVGRISSFHGMGSTELEQKQT